jgi:hypothetical protein
MVYITCPAFERLEAVSAEVWEHYIVVFEGCLRTNPTTVQQVQQCVARQQAQESHWLCNQADCELCDSIGLGVFSFLATD